MPIRFSRAVVLGLLAALVGALSAPAPASAAETLQVTLVAAVPSAEYGADVAFAATVTSNGVPVPDASVWLLRTGPDGVTTYVDYSETDAAGAAALTDTAAGPRDVRRERRCRRVRRGDRNLGSGVAGRAVRRRARGVAGRDPSRAVGSR